MSQATGIKFARGTCDHTAASRRGNVEITGGARTVWERKQQLLMFELRPRGRRYNARSRPSLDTLQGRKGRDMLNSERIGEKKTKAGVREQHSDAQSSADFPQAHSKQVEVQTDTKPHKDKKQTSPRKQHAIKEIRKTEKEEDDVKKKGRRHAGR